MWVRRNFKILFFLKNIIQNEKEKQWCPFILGLNENSLYVRLWISWGEDKLCVKIVKLKKMINCYCENWQMKKKEKEKEKKSVNKREIKNKREKLWHT